MPYVEYSKEAIQTLCKRDAMLKSAIERIGPIRRERTPNVFVSLVHSLVAQQISTKAAQAIWNRLYDATEINAKVLSAMDESALRELGLSGRKALYIRGAAQAVVSGALDIKALDTMSDEKVKESLCALYGVGEWTAEMMMIFSLGRPDVLSERDVGIVRGIKWVYGLDALTPAFIQSLKTRVSPYGTVASLYFWAVASGE